MTTEAFDVVIIGAGPSGLATAGQLHKKYGPKVNFVVLEGSDLVGSSWRKRYLRLHLHTPKATSALPYLPYPRNIPTYPSAGQVVDHMREYVRHFDLPVRLRHHVASLEYDDKTRLYKITVQVWSGDDSDMGGYTGVPKAAATQTVTMTCKAVVMATGCNSVPFTPVLPGRDLFKGAVVHSSDYKDGSPYRGQRVLVVGSGNSGGEISVCLSEHGAVPTLLIRRKDLIVITPDDGLVTSLLLKFDIKRQVVPWIKWLDKIAGLITQIKAPNMRAYGIPQIFPGWFGNRGIFEGNRKMDPPFIDVGQCAAIKKGLIKVARGELVGYTPTGVKIGPATGTTGPVVEQEFDAVILCTGYEWAGSITRVLPPKILAKILPSDGKPPGSGVETAQPGLYLIGLEDMIGRLAMIGQEGGAIAESIGQLLGLERA